MQFDTAGVGGRGSQEKEDVRQHGYLEHGFCDVQLIKQRLN